MSVLIKRNDTLPVFKATLNDVDGDVAVLSGATVKFIMVDKDGDEKVSAAAVITGAGTGQVEYRWIPTDTDTVGSYRGEFEVTFSDGNIMTFPNDGYIVITIIGDLG